MTRFQRIQTNKTLITHFVDKLNEIGYRNVPDLADGDQDFLVIDTFRREYIWCENGSYPFSCDKDMYQYEFHQNPETVCLKRIEMGLI